MTHQSDRFCIAQLMGFFIVISKHEQHWGNDLPLLRPETRGREKPEAATVLILLVENPEPG